MFDISTLLASTATLMATYLLYKSIRKPLDRKGDMIPGPKGLPFIGMSHKINSEIFHIQILSYVEKYGEILQMRLMGSNIVFLNSVRLMRKCFGEDPLRHEINDRPPFHYCKLIPESEGSLACHRMGGGNDHIRLRKAFNKGLGMYGEGVKSFEEKICVEIDNMTKRIDGNQGREFEMSSIIQQSMVSLVSVLITGQEILEGDERYSMMLSYVYGMNNLLSSDINSVLLGMPFMRFVPGPWKEAHCAVVTNLELITKDILLKYKETYNPKVFRGFIDYLIGLQKEDEYEKETGSGNEEIFFTDGKIVGFLGDIIVAGISTTRAVLSGALFCLFQHPEIQKKGQEEVFRVIGRVRGPTLKDKPNCPYIEAISNEVHRYISILPLGLAHYVEEETTLDNYLVPEKSVVLANNFYALHDEKIWGDPWVFRPERFLDASGDLLPRDHPIRRSMMPFSNGKRRCVGEDFARSRIFLFLTTFIQRWTFVKSRDEPTTCDPRSSNYLTDVTTYPKPYYCKAVKNF